jgi:hypothetical protein
MQSPICIVSERHKHFGLSRQVERRSLVKSVKVVMVISVSLHHQQCYNFRKIHQENAKWTGAVVYIRCFTVSFSPWAPCKGVYYTSVRAWGLCPLLTWHTRKTIRGICRHRTAGRLTTGCRAVRLQVWHPWLILEISLIFRHDVTRGHCIFAFSVSNQFTDLIWGHEPPFLWNTTTTHDCWQNIQSDQRQRSEMPYYSAEVWLCHLQSSLFISFHTSNSNEIYNPVPFANEAYQFQCKLWENHDLTVWPVITYIYLCGLLYASCFSYLKMSFSNMAETELKVTQGLEKPFTIAIFPYTDSWCLVPFSSNVSLDPKHKSISCFGCG